MEDEEEGESFFDMLNKEPVNSSKGSVTFDDVLSSESEAGISSRDFVRIEALESGPGGVAGNTAEKQRILIPRLSFGDKKLSSTAPAAESSRESEDAEASFSPSFAGQSDPNEQLTLAELLAVEQHRQQLQQSASARSPPTESGPTVESNRSRSGSLSARGKLSSRLRGKSVGHREDPPIDPVSSVEASPEKVKTREGRSRSIADVIFRRSLSKESGLAVSRMVVEASSPKEDDGPVAFSDFLEQEQFSSEDSSHGPTSPSRSASADNLSPLKRGFVLGRGSSARNASGGLRRKSPGLAARQTSGTLKSIGRKSSATSLSPDFWRSEEVAKLMEDPEIVFALLDYSIAALCEENIAILQAIAGFRDASTEFLRRQQAQRIMTDFVFPDALRPINVDARTLGALQKSYAELQDGSPVPLSLFDDLLSQVHLLIRTDVLPRFWESSFFKTMMEGAVLRSSYLGSSKDLLSSVRASCSLHGWKDIGLDSTTGVELWERADAGDKASSHSCRGMVRVRASATVVSEGLMDLGRYSDWAAPLVEKSLLVKRLGSFFRIAQLQLGGDGGVKAGLLAGSLFVGSSLEQNCVALISLPPSALDVPTGGARFLDLLPSGFVVMPEGDGECRVVASIALKPPSKKFASLSARTLVVGLLTGLKDRNFLAESHMDAQKMPDEIFF